ncbi:hypothetical protein P1X14_20990 [Sphingomonas sp. AOB5]|uniref:hypothetical protein n=1 Tax=Sphingomonas sp. AOB5 TaxID=3034017 RepID=UPI0023F98719|nr:hypothetical protein [Sphingomonas sp. AOB5]MDF7777745.1 hypothetical protein [Sphingomonas sp. AOB5]
MRICLAVAAFLLALPAAAQVRPPADPDEIVVTGRETDKRQVRDYVAGMTGMLGADPVARFESDLCPRAFGLTPDFDRLVTARMRRVAAGAGIKLAAEDCQATALILFAPDPRATIEVMRKTYPRLFEQPNGQPIRLARQRGPVIAWHVTAKVDRDGRRLEIDDETGQYILESADMPSGNQAMVRPVYLMSIVVIDSDSLEGLTVNQVADYATMRALTAADPARIARTAAPTILTVIDAPMGSVTAGSVTQWDLSFLRALYTAPPNLRGRTQRSGIGDRMAEDIQKAPDTR